MTPVASATASSPSSASKRQQGLRQPGQIPLRNLRLILVGITAILINRTEHRFRIVGLHECTGAVVDGFPGNAHIVGVHYAVDKTHAHPLRHQSCLALDDCTEKVQIAPFPSRQSGIVSCNGVIRQLSHTFMLAAGSIVFKASDTDMADGNSRQCCARQDGFATNWIHPWRQQPKRAWLEFPMRASPRRSTPRATSARRQPFHLRCARRALALNP